MTILFNRFEERENRRGLRRKSATAEKILWRYLCNRGLNDLKFRRQFSVSHFVIDFYCPAKKLAVELDGDVHDNPDARLHDELRDKYLKELGIRVIRINNEDVFTRIKVVLEVIAKQPDNLTPAPLLRKEREISSLLRQEQYF